tara:strand:- start:276 stop:1427 length:1152 start_codon:yes stop_codon:yes gene_type:complete
MDLREVAAAYQSLYNINEEVLEEDINIDDLSQEDVDELVEELVYEFLEEGYSIEDIEESFNESIENEFLVEEVEEEVLSEARRAKRQPGASQGPEQKRKSLMQSQREKLNQQRAEKKQAKKDKVAKDKSAAMTVRPSDALATTPKKSKGGALAKKASGAITKAVEKVKVRVHGKDTKSLAGGEKTKSLPQGVKGGAIVKRNETVGAKTTPKQQAAAKAKETVKKGVGYALKKRDMKRGNRRDVVFGKKTKIDKLKDKASSVRVDVTNAAKGLKRKAGKALGKLASKLSEEGGQLDSFDTVVAYLIDEGIASDFDEATAKMAKLSEATVAKIHASQIKLLDEAYTVTNADKKGNTTAYQNYKKGMKGKDGKPMYKAADHMKGDK